MHGVNSASPLVLSLKISWPLHSVMKLIMMKNFLIDFMLLLPSFIRMLPPSMKKQILKSHLFLCLLKGNFSYCDTNDEKEVTYGVSADIDVDYDPITHSLFSKSPILDSEIYVQDYSHLVHTSLIDGAQPSDFQDVCLAKSSLICAIPLTLLYRM